VVDENDPANGMGASRSLISSQRQTDPEGNLQWLLVRELELPTWAHKGKRIKVHS
jgi:hypothetical protein